MDLKKEIDMSLQLNNALMSGQTAWSSALQTGIPAHVPAFQPVIKNLPHPAIASRLDWLDDEYREAYLEASVEQNIAWQIKFNRESRNLDQKEFAKLLGTGQSAVSRMEDPSYGRLNLKSILKVAHIFKCAISIKLISYSELAEQNQSFSKKTVLVNSFDDEAILINGDL